MGEVLGSENRSLSGSTLTRAPGWIGDPQPVAEIFSMSAVVEIAGVRGR